jgi:hypothetical protein
MSDNFYHKIVVANKHKLLNHYNFDEFSESSYYADRLHWGWKVSDFSNATLWSGINTINYLYKSGEINTELYYKLFLGTFNSISKIASSQKGLQEAYPNENSFCVTALIAFDLLLALKETDHEELLKYTSRDISYYTNIVKPYINFIETHNENHAIISNHIATAVAAIELWNTLTKSKSNRGKELWQNVILKNQSNEGWYKEYESADPGYQTLCTYYLAAAHKYSSNSELKASILSSVEKSINYLEYFIQPDASIGGLYGSRNTEIYYPGGLEYFSEYFQKARNIAQFVRKSLLEGVHVKPESIDIGNYIPLLNAYTFASKHWKIETESTLVWQDNFERNFNESGIFVKSTDSYYLIINYKKGGCFKLFDKQSRSLYWEEGGAMLSLNAQRYSTQMYAENLQFDSKSIVSNFYKFNEAYPNPLNFVILRILGLTVFKSNFLGELFKKMIVKMLMTNKKILEDFEIEISFQLNDDNVIVSSKPSKSIEYSFPNGKYKTIHMASSGYYTSQLEMLEGNRKRLSEEKSLLKVKKL